MSTHDPNAVGAMGSTPALSPATGGLPPIEVGWATDPGREPSKQVNEDAAFARHTHYGHLAVVCDGMGGHVGGSEASALAIDTIFRYVDAAPPGLRPANVLGDAIRDANRAVLARGGSRPELKGMGSTCVAVLTHGGGSEVAHVGDSRVYLLTQGQIYQVTKDHSLVQRLVDANMLTPEEASNHPNANQITNALGMRPDVEVEVRPQAFPNARGDTFILCSDGLSDEVGPQDILAIVSKNPTCDAAARQLVDLANARGGHDNITLVIVRLAGGQPFAAAGGPIATPVAQPALGGSAPLPLPTLEMEVTPPPPMRSAPATPIMSNASSAPPVMGAMGALDGRAHGQTPHHPPQPGHVPYAPLPGMPEYRGAPTGGIPLTPTPPMVQPIEPVMAALPQTQREAAPPAPAYAPHDDEPIRRRRGSSGTVVVVAAIVVLLLAAGGLAYWWTTRAQQSAPPPSTIEPAPSAPAQPKTGDSPALKKADKPRAKAADDTTDLPARPSDVLPPVERPRGGSPKGGQPGVFGGGTLTLPPRGIPTPLSPTPTPSSGDLRHDPTPEPTVKKSELSQ